MLGGVNEGPGGNMRRLLLLALLTPALALGQEPPPAEGDAAPRFGISGSLGFPDGVAASALFRPIDMLRLSAGGTWNYFGFGVQAGADVKPLQWPIAPTLGVEVGHYFDADLTWLAAQDAGVPPELEPLLEKVGYSYASAHLGVEVGSSRRLVLFARAGLSYFWTTVNGASQAVSNAGTGTVTVRIEDPKFRATLPSVKLGIIFFL
jgi:hypothetical protein